jgi:hypothetical protein
MPRPPLHPGYTASRRIPVSPRVPQPRPTPLASPAPEPSHSATPSRTTTPIRIPRADPYGVDVAIKHIGLHGCHIHIVNSGRKECQTAVT